MKNRDNSMENLFRNRLQGAEIEVRDNFWEELQGSLLQESGKAGRVVVVRFRHWMAVASVALLLGVASASLWYFSPREEIKEAFTQVAVLAPQGEMPTGETNSPYSSPAETSSSSVAAAPTSFVPLPIQRATQASGEAEEEAESISLHLSITISQRGYPSSDNEAGYAAYGQNNKAGQRVSDYGSSAEDSREEENEEKKRVTGEDAKWAIKAAVGSSLPKGDFGMPLAVGVMLERRLDKTWALETGLQYNRLPMEGSGQLHTLSLPVRLDATLATSAKVDFYATVGGALEKAVGKGRGGEPVQLSAMAGVGVRYKLNERIAFFAEPSLAYHFDTDSELRTLHTERPANMNLLCGVRMVY